eukprot:g1817.t1
MTSAGVQLTANLSITGRPEMTTITAKTTGDRRHFYVELGWTLTLKWLNLTGGSMSGSYPNDRGVTAGTNFYLYDDDDSSNSGADKYGTFSRKTGTYGTNVTHGSYDLHGMYVGKILHGLECGVLHTMDKLHRRLLHLCQRNEYLEFCLQQLYGWKIFHLRQRILVQRLDNLPCRPKDSRQRHKQRRPYLRNLPDWEILYRV